MEFVFSTDETSIDLPDGFFYVGQDNYCIVNLSKKAGDRKYLYSDSATSCIIMVIEGKNASGDPIVVITHLSRTARFDVFFNIVTANFVGPVSVWAQGANPPDAEASITNTNTLMSYLDFYSLNNFEAKPAGEKPSWFVECASLSLGQGNPREDDRGCYGIDIEKNIVSNKPFKLTLEDRDPTKGVQTLFCVFGMKVWKHCWLWRAGDEFPKDVVDRLVRKAKEENWTQILDMTDEEILKKYSSTPEYEPDWFVNTLRQSAKFVKDYSIS